MELDIRTLIVTLAISSLGSAVMIFLIYRLHSSVQGTLLWVYGGFTIAFSLILLSLRGHLPDFVTIVLANTAVCYGLSITLSGMRIFIGRSSILKFTLTTPMAVAPLLFWYSEVQPSLAVRSVICSIAISAFSGAIAYELLKNSKFTGGLAQRLTGFIYAINTLFHLVRILLTIIQPPSGSFLTSGTVTVALLLWLPIYSIGFTTGMVLMISERLQEEVKTLGGLLPICGHCKKIRDEKGYWDQVESYIEEHSEVEFSHGICPECAEKFYPDMDLYAEN